MLPVLIGFVGFAVDVGYAFDYKKQMQLAADSAAMAGAMAVKANGSINSTDLATVVTMDTANNGFTNGNGGIAINVCRPGVDVDCPTTYTYVAGDNAVKVSISQTRDTFFTKILSFNSMTIGASAVAAKANGSGNTNNIVILDTNCDKGMDVTGGSDITLAGSIYVNACGNPGISVSGGGTINAAGGVFVACNPGATFCGTAAATGGSTYGVAPTLYQPQIADPLASLPEPTPSGTNWGSVTHTSGTHTIQPGIYTDLSIQSTANVTFAPGEYFINGGSLEIKTGAQVTGTGVFIYAYNNAQLSIGNNATVVTLSAPTSGTYRGILYFQQRSDVQDADVSGGATVNLDGVIYISNPSAKLTFSGGSSSGALASYTVFVVWELIMGGGGTFGTDFSAIGGSPLAGNTAGLALAE